VKTTRSFPTILSYHDSTDLTASSSPSRSEAKRLGQQGGVSLDGKAITDEKAIVTLDTEKTIKVGKRKFLRVKNG